MVAYDVSLYHNVPKLQAADYGNELAMNPPSLDTKMSLTDRWLSRFLGPPVTDTYPSTQCDNHRQPGARPRSSAPRNNDGEIVCLHDECKDEQPTFKRLCEFNKHMNKHERPYKCVNAACRKNPGFTYAGGLLRHQREVHGMHKTKDLFFCPQPNCDRNTGSGFSRRENLEEHLRRRHSGIDIGSIHVLNPPRYWHSDKQILERPVHRIFETKVYDPRLRPELVLAKQPADLLLVQQGPVDTSSMAAEEEVSFDITTQQAQPSILRGPQWDAIFASHRNLLHEHHDSLTTFQQHVSDATKDLATKYVMPAQMWGFLEYPYLVTNSPKKTTSSLERSIVGLDTPVMAHCTGAVAKMTSAPATNMAGSVASTTEAISLVSSKMGDKNVVPFMHVVPANLYNPSFVVELLTWVEACIDWSNLALFLNTVGRSGVSYSNTELENFLPSQGGHGKQLPEDFIMRGMMTSCHYYEPELFTGPLIDEQEKTDVPCDSILWRFSRFIQAVCNPNSRLLSLATFGTMIYPVRAYPDDANDMPQGPNLPRVILLCAVCGLLSTTIPFLGPRMSTRNVAAQASILAFIASLAMSASKTQQFLDLWGATWMGISLGSSAWLWRSTRSPKNSMLFEFFRYVVPTVVLWQLLSSSELSNHGQYLDLSRSVPCLSVFGAVFCNAFINEKINELCGFFHWLWERILLGLGLERIRTADMV